MVTCDSAYMYGCLPAIRVRSFVESWAWPRGAACNLFIVEIVSQSMGRFLEKIRDRSFDCQSPVARPYRYQWSLVVLGGKTDRGRHRL